MRYEYRAAADATHSSHDRLRAVRELVRRGNRARAGIVDSGFRVANSHFQFHRMDLFARARALSSGGGTRPRDVRGSVSFGASYEAERMNARAAARS